MYGSVGHRFISSFLTWRTLVAHLAHVEGGWGVRPILATLRGRYSSSYTDSGPQHTTEDWQTESFHWTPDAPTVPHWMLSLVRHTVVPGLQSGRS